jgi:hypothetical protein
VAWADGACPSDDALLPALALDCELSERDLLPASTCQTGAPPAIHNAITTRTAADNLAIHLGRCKSTPTRHLEVATDDLCKACSISPRREVREHTFVITNLGDNNESCDNRQVRIFKQVFTDAHSLHEIRIPLFRIAPEQTHSIS